MSWNGCDLFISALCHMSVISLILNRCLILQTPQDLDCPTESTAWDLWWLFALWKHIPGILAVLDSWACKKPNPQVNVVLLLNSYNRKWSTGSITWKASPHDMTYLLLIHVERNKHSLTAFYILSRHCLRCSTHLIISNPHSNLASDGTLIPIPVLQMGKLRLREV